jgi:hypothetical protein
MQLFDPKKAGTPTSGLFNAKEKRRFGLMAVGAVVLVIAVVSIKMSGSLREKERLADFQPPVEPLQTEVSVPKIDGTRFRFCQRQSFQFSSVASG